MVNGCVQGCGRIPCSQKDRAECKISRAVLGAAAFIVYPTPLSKPVWLKTSVDDLGFSKLAFRKLEFEWGNHLSPLNTTFTQHLPICIEQVYFNLDNFNL